MIFISYRRADNIYLAAAVRDALVARLGSRNSVFFDLASIPPGAAFADDIRRAIDASEAVLVLIGRDWHHERLCNPGDFVRLELMAGHELGKRIVPVLHSGQPMPSAAELPRDLAWLLDHNAFTIAEPPRDRADLERLADHVAEWVRPPNRNAPVKRHDNLDFMTHNSAIAGAMNRLTAAFRRRTSNEHHT